MNFADAAITYGPNGIRCGCGKPAHSNLSPCDGPEAWRPAGPLTAEQLAAITARHEAATPGLWEPYTEYGPNFVANQTGQHMLGVGDLDFGTGQQADADRDFVRQAHADITALLAENARLREENEHLRGYIVTAGKITRDRTTAPEARIAELDEMFNG